MPKNIIGCDILIKGKIFSLPGNLYPQVSCGLFQFIQVSFDYQKKLTSQY